MNKALFRMIGMLALALMAATQTVRAQELRVSVPFTFTAGKTALPAGEYQIQKPAGDSPALLIQRTDGSAAVILISFAASPKEEHVQSRLVFHHYGDHYFLAQVWRADASRGRQFPVTAQEKEQALALRNQTRNQVVIAASITLPKP
ncbi:MAG TPA: hypothetical protein VI431_18495 [Candidatus Acidoferrum sp.]